MENISGEVIRPFGPAIAKVTMSDEIVQKLNNYVDKIIVDKKKN